MNVRLGKNGDEIIPGNIFIAPGERHMTLAKGTLQIELTDGEPVNFVKPAADPLFKSIASVFGSMSMALVLTGMGHDGTAGAMHISNAGGSVIVQDPDTAVIHAMPLSVINSGLADKIVPLQEIPAAISGSILSIIKKLCLLNFLPVCSKLILQAVL